MHNWNRFSKHSTSISTFKDTWALGSQPFGSLYCTDYTLREEGDLEKTRISGDLHSFGAGQIRFSVVSHGVGFSPRIGAKPNRQDTGFSPLLSLIYILEVLHTWTLFQGDNRGQRAWLPTNAFRYVHLYSAYYKAKVPRDTLGCIATGKSKWFKTKLDFCIDTKPSTLSVQNVSPFGVQWSL